MLIFGAAVAFARISTQASVQGFISFIYFHENTHTWFLEPLNCLDSLNHFIFDLEFDHARIALLVFWVDIA